MFLAASVRCGKAILFPVSSDSLSKICFILLDDNNHDGRREFYGKYAKLRYASSESHFTIPCAVSGIFEFKIVNTCIKLTCCHIK